MGYTSRDDLNYLGILTQVGDKKTPFLNAVGGLGNGATTNTFEFPLGQKYSVATGSQPAISEDTSVGAQTATTVTRTQVYNTTQIFQECYEVSYAKESTFGNMSGLNLNGNNPVTSELSFQRMSAMKKIANDLNYSILRGVYQASTGKTVAPKTRGLVTAITTNAINASSAILDKALVDALLIAMSNKADFENMVFICGAYQLAQLNNIFAFQPMSYNVGGTAINKIVTNYGEMGVMFEPNLATTDLVLADMNKIRMVYTPIKGKVVIDEPLAKVGASDKNQIYLQAGIDYGIEEYHGKITSLKDS
ncbi:MAG: SU10 major capsid protein [Cetobacterium sp.]